MTRTRAAVTTTLLALSVASDVRGALEGIVPPSYYAQLACVVALWLLWLMLLDADDGSGGDAGAGPKSSAPVASKKMAWVMFDCEPV